MQKSIAYALSICVKLLMFQKSENEDTSKQIICKIASENVLMSVFYRQFKIFICFVHTKSVEIVSCAYIELYITSGNQFYN